MQWYYCAQHDEMTSPMIPHDVTAHDCVATDLPPKSALSKFHWTVSKLLLHYTGYNSAERSATQTRKRVVTLLVCASSICCAVVRDRHSFLSDLGVVVAEIYTASTIAPCEVVGCRDSLPAVLPGRVIRLVCSGLKDYSFQLVNYRITCKCIIMLPSGWHLIKASKGEWCGDWAAAAGSET